MKEKKLLVEWKIGTFGVYNLTTTTTNRPEKNRKQRIEGRKKVIVRNGSELLAAAPLDSALDVMICLTTSVHVSRSYGALAIIGLSHEAEKDESKRKEDCNYSTLSCSFALAGQVFFEASRGQSSLMATKSE